MTPIPYHNIRNIVNPIFLYLITTYATMRQNAAGDIFRSGIQLPYQTALNPPRFATQLTWRYGRYVERIWAEYGSEMK